VDNFRHLGLQRRIMLYLTIGLATMFGVSAIVGSAAIDEAAALVFDERLATAYTTAGIIERDFARLAADVRSTQEADPRLPGDHVAEAQRFVDDLGTKERYPFFSVIGACLADADMRVIADVGPTPSTIIPFDRCTEKVRVSSSFQVARASWTADAQVALADLVVPLDRAAPGDAAFAVLRLASSNQTIPFDPASFGRVREGSGPPPDSGVYNLEIIDPDGVTVLGIGRDERSGAPSDHYPAIRQTMATGTAVALVDAGNAADGVEPHVMAVVPLSDTPFFLLLEQPTDVALALPNQLRERLVVLIVVGFLAAAAVAWVTTRRVVQPTERLTAAAERMARGDFESPIQVSAQDEVAVLAETLDLMRLQLRDALEQLEQSNRDLERRVAERTARLGQVLRKIISAQEDERHALARELHDETAQTLAALSIALDRARDEMSHGSSSALEQIQGAKEIATRLLAETRRLILGLRPSVLDDLGLGPAIAWYAETTLAAEGVEVVLDLKPATRPPAHLEVSLFRIAQEAISNVAKHAHARNARIGLLVDESSATLSIEDDGVGFSVAETLLHGPHRGSVGLAGMQERVALLGGRLEIDSQAGEGSRIVVIVPLIEEAA
jgi:signal transduction histidine kinase